MDLLKGASEITISYSDPKDFEDRKTNNHVAESELHSMLSLAVKTGVNVFCNISGDTNSLKLKLTVDKNDNFYWEAV